MFLTEGLCDHVQERTSAAASTLETQPEDLPLLANFRNGQPPQPAHWILPRVTAKPPSGRIALHSEMFFNLGDYGVTAKPPSGRIALHSEMFLT